MQKIQKFLISLLVVIGIVTIVLEIPTIADWGDYDSYDSSSSYDDWGSSDWDSSSSDWDSSSSSWGWDDDYHSSSSSGDFFFGYLLGSLFNNHPALGFILFFVIFFGVVGFIVNAERNKKSGGYSQSGTIMHQVDRNTELQRQRNREVLFGVSDTPIEDEIQAEDPMFNKAEFLSWASDMFVKLQYAWSDRNLENIRYFVTPELYEQTNNQVQRYITNKQINKLERVSVNLSRLYSFESQGDREILRIVLESKMVDYIVDEATGKVLRGDPSFNNVNPYILTFVRKSGVKTPEGGIKPVTMNCPNCGGATTILSSGKCPYCGSVITTRDNNWTLSEMKRYNPNA